MKDALSIREPEWHYQSFKQPIACAKGSHSFAIFNYSYLMKDMDDIKLCKSCGAPYMLKHLINK